MAHPVPMLPFRASASVSESDRWVLHPSSLVRLEPEFTQELSAIYNEAAADTEEYYRPVEFRGNLLQHAADSEGGVSAYFVQVAQAADDMLKQKGLTGVGHVCLATASVLSRLAVQQPSKLPAVLGALALDAGAAAAAWPGSMGSGTSSSAAATAATPGSFAPSTADVAAAEVPLNSHRSSSSNSLRLKPDLILLLTPEQARSLGAQRYVAAFGELKMRSKLLTADGVPKDLVHLYNTGDPVVVSLMGQLLTYMNAFKVGMLLLAVEVEVGVCTRVLPVVRAICLVHSGLLSSIKGPFWFTKPLCLHLLMVI